MENGREGRAAPDGERISLWRLDQLLAGELPEAEAEALRAEIAKSDSLRAYMERQGQAKSGLTLEKIRAAIAKPASTRVREETSVRPETESGNHHGRLGMPTTRRVARDRIARNRVADESAAWWRSILPAPRGRAAYDLTTRGVALGFGFMLMLGLGIWTFQAGQQAGYLRPSENPGLTAKGAVQPGFRLDIAGTAYDAGQLAPARTGDTLGVRYRSAAPVFAQVWYQEENGKPARMTGNDSLADVAWAPATAWSPAPLRIVLEGDWKRQTVWIVWSGSDFTAGEALARLAGGSARANLRAEPFRLIRPESKESDSIRLDAARRKASPSAP